MSLAQDDAPIGVRNERGEAERSLLRDDTLFYCVALFDDAVTLVLRAT